jgi:hypothetical protein
MANEMPSSENYTGVTRKVLRCSEDFLRIVNEIKQPGFREADWAPLGRLIAAHRRGSGHR